MLIEFLIKGPDGRDIRWHDYAADFHLELLLTDRLSAAWKRASEQVTHLSRARVPTADSPIFERVDAAGLRRLADDVFVAMAIFMSHLTSAGEPYAEDFAGWLAEADAALTYVPVKIGYDRSATTKQDQR